jgi:hypothetical protein
MSNPGLPIRGLLDIIGKYRTTIMDARCDLPVNMGSDFERRVEAPCAGLPHRLQLQPAYG